MGLEQYQLVLTEHAFQRYIQRVGPIARQQLELSITEQLQMQYRRSGRFLQTMDETWWRISIQDRTVTFHTCYGRHSIDLPNAIKWARRNKDRIALGGIYWR